MYKVLNIGGQDYKLEFSIEASLYADCVSELTNILTDVGIAGIQKDVKMIISGISNVPKATLSMFYAGLMEAHGTHPDGDGKVPDINTAKKLITQYIKEHSEDGLGNFYNIMQMLIAQMEEDGFFNLIGLETLTEKMMDASKKPKENKKASEK
jgi:hypothetical protein